MSRYQALGSSFTLYLQLSTSEHYGLHKAYKNSLHGPENLSAVRRVPRIIRHVWQTVILYNKDGHQNTVEQFLLWKKEIPKVHYV